MTKRFRRTKSFYKIKKFWKRNTNLYSNLRGISQSAQIDDSILN